MHDFCMFMQKFKYFCLIILLVLQLLLAVPHPQVAFLASSDQPLLIEQPLLIAVQLNQIAVQPLLFTVQSLSLTSLSCSQSAHSSSSACCSA